jgi:two-component system, response regulator YesN
MPFDVLIADDEPFIVRGLKKIIPWEDLGYRIVGEASDGAEAARLLVELEPDIMVSDICMPGMSGIELLKLASISKLAVKVIFLSGHREFSFAREAVTYGAVDYLMKPIRVDELTRALGRAVELIARDGGGGEATRSEPRGSARPPSRAESADFIDLSPRGEWPLLTAFAFLEREEPASSGEGEAGRPRNLRLLRFAIINLLKKFSSPEREISAAEREGAVLVVMGHGPGEDPAAFLELALASVLTELGAGLAASRGPTLASEEGPRASCEAALGGLLGAGSAGPKGSEVAGVKRAMELMESRFKEALTLETVAAAACMNPYYFSALFKKRTGVNFKDYLSRLRAEEGRRLLLTTDLSFSEIASLSGLGDARRFGETFKKHFGTAPAEYRSAIKRRMPK